MTARAPNWCVAAPCVAVDVDDCCRPDAVAAAVGVAGATAVARVDVKNVTYYQNDVAAAVAAVDDKKNRQHRPRQMMNYKKMHQMRIL